jgi:hypothetical protein
MTNPLFEAIERLTNPYALQERVYRNRVDTADAAMATLEARHGVTWFAPVHGDTPAPLCNLCGEYASVDEFIGLE